ncbi:MAG: hypothetical protein SNI70_06090 [Rikenellaceae bacterium]
MVTKINISYTDAALLFSMERQLTKTEDVVNALFAHLKKNGENNIEEARSYQLKGASHKRDAFIKECEDYIASTNMPQFLQADARKRADEQVSADYVETIAGSLHSLKDVELTPDNIEYHDNIHSWVLSESYKSSVLSRANKTLTDEEQVVYDKLQSVFEAMDEIAQSHQVKQLITLYGETNPEAIAYKIAKHRNPLTLEEAKAQFPDRFGFDND